jgi:hypothetical protein
MVSCRFLYREPDLSGYAFDSQEDFSLNIFRGMPCCSLNSVGDNACTYLGPGESSGSFIEDQSGISLCVKSMTDLHVHVLSILPGILSVNLFME